MRAGLTFLILQGKKYSKVVPAILWESLLFALLILGFGGYASKAMQKEASIGKIQVGIISSEESGMTGLLVRFVESMDSFQDSCSFQIMEQKEAEDSLAKGEIYAALFLPEGVVEGILDGNNPSVKILLGHAYSQMETQVFGTVAQAGNRLLSVAQAGIYAADELCLVTGHSELTADAERYLNDAYLDYALNRTAVFKLHEIQATGKVGLTAYYSFSLLLVFLSFVGMIMGRYVTVKPSALSDWLAASRFGYAGQFMMEALAFSGVFALFGMVLGIPTLLFAMHVENQGTPEMVGILLLFLLLLSLGALIRLLVELTGKESGGLGIGFGILFLLMLISGLLLPAAFLPSLLEKAGHFSPYRYWLNLLIAIGKKDTESEMAGWLFLLFAGMIAAGMAIFWLRKITGEGVFPVSGRTQEKASEAGKITSGRMTMLSILCKQYLVKHRIWFLVLFLAACLLGIWKGNVENTEKAGLFVGVYAEDERGEALCERLGSETGIFHFICFDGEEEMRKQVENGSLECAYVFPEGFYEKLQDGKKNRQIHLYYAPGASAYKLSYEVVFSHLLAMLSDDILQGWLEESGLSKAASFEELTALKEQYETDGSTFSFQYEEAEELQEAGQEKAGEESRDAVIDPLRGCIAAAVFFISLLGLGNCCELWGTADRLPGVKAGKVRECSLHITAFGAVLSGAVLLFVSGYFVPAQVGKEISGLFLYLIILEGYLRILRVLLKKAERVYGMIPILLLGSLLFGPVFIQIKIYIPAIAFIEKLFPTTWYLRHFL